MTIVDTSIWIDYLNDRISRPTVWLDQRLSLPDVGLTDSILMEVLQGVREDTVFRSTHDALLGFPVFDTGGHELAIVSAEHFRWLRKRGITIRSTVDCVIATFCIREGYSLLHNDRDFDAFEKHFGLRVIDPEADK